MKCVIQLFQLFVEHTNQRRPYLTKEVFSERLRLVSQTTHRDDCCIGSLNVSAQQLEWLMSDFQSSAETSPPLLFCSPLFLSRRTPTFAKRKLMRHQVVADRIEAVLAIT